MTYPQIAVLIITLLSVSTNSKSITNSEKNVTKRDSPDDLFPDWVPFKNKRGDELGEFVAVEPKKPKKRLALPVNFILRAVAEPEGEDYYDKGQGGESDGEDYFEKREWSDTNRPAATRPTTLPPVNHTEISDIDGVVGIIVKHHPNDDLLKQTPTAVSANEDTPSSESKEDEGKKEEVVKVKEKQSEQNQADKKGKRLDEYMDYEDAASTEKPSEKKSAAEEEEEREKQREAEARKAKILDAVDELKLRHEQESKAISEKLKEEAMHKEEFERDFISSEETGDKYNRRIVKRPDYDEYDDKDSFGVEDKYKLFPMRRRTTTTTTSTTSRPSTRRRKDKKAKDSEDSGKLSVFRNPSVYMVYDEDYDSSTKTSPKNSKSTLSIPDTATTERRYSSKYSTSTPLPRKLDLEDAERISLVPDDAELKEGEPTLFFPKRRKNKRKRKNKSPSSSTHEPPLMDAHMAETVQKSAMDKNHTASKDAATATKFVAMENVTDTTASDVKVTATGTGPTGPSASSPSASGVGESTTDSSSEESAEAISTGTSASGVSAPSRTVPPTLRSTETTSSEGTSEKYRPLSADSAESAPTGVTADAESAPSDHKKEEHKDGDYEHEKAGDHEHHAEHHSSHEESGKKAYEGKHEDSKTAQGHHDKEDHVGSYHDHGGVDKHHLDEKKHYGTHHHEEHGKKHAKYEESGKHSKGHSTKGSHDVHKKEEYEKKVEFFEEEGDSLEEEKHGGHAEEHKHGAGGHFKKGDLHGGHHHHTKGENGHFHKGGHGFAHKGHAIAGGHDEHGKHGSEGAHKHGKSSGKKWVYHHGHPAKNANLVLIDRRADQLYHGPQYYG